jgi:hypothetical protein
MISQFVYLSGLNSLQLGMKKMHFPEVRHSRVCLAGIQEGCSDWAPD